MSIWLSWDDTYEVSLEGDLRNRSKPDYIFKKVPINTGYIQYSIKGKWLKIHYMVATLFLPAPTEQGLEIDHIDRNKLNNHASNLRWITRSLNQQNKPIMTRAPISKQSDLPHHIHYGKTGRLYARVKRQGVNYLTPVVDTIEEAIEARDKLLTEHS